MKRRTAVEPSRNDIDAALDAMGADALRAELALVPIIAQAPAEPKTREAWLDRLWNAHAEDQIPYIERLADYWGELCAFQGGRLRVGRPAPRHHPDGAQQPEAILADLVATPPGEEGKWFTAAKALGLYDAAIELAHASPCEPTTLARAARDHAANEPDFAIEAGYCALHWLAQGFGYEVTSVDVRMAYSSVMKAADALGRAPETKAQIRALAESRPSFVTDVLGRELELRR